MNKIVLLAMILGIDKKDLDKVIRPSTCEGCDNHKEDCDYSCVNSRIFWCYPLDSQDFEDMYNRFASLYDIFRLGKYKGYNYGVMEKYCDEEEDNEE